MSITVEDISRYLALRIGQITVAAGYFEASGNKEMIAEIKAREQELTQLQLYIGLKADDENQRNDGDAKE